MAKTKKQEQEIAKLISFTDKFRVYFENFERKPLFGKFVRCGDHEELTQKGMVRFVSDSRVEEWDETGDETLTRILALIEIRSSLKF